MKYVETAFGKSILGIDGTTSAEREKNPEPIKSEISRKRRSQIHIHTRKAFFLVCRDAKKMTCDDLLYTSRTVPTLPKWKPSYIFQNCTLCAGSVREK